VIDHLLACLLIFAGGFYAGIAFMAALQASGRADLEIPEGPDAGRLRW